MATKVPKRNRKKKNTITEQEKSSYLLSLACTMVCSYIFLSFIKASINSHYLVGLYVDSAVSVVALVIFVFQVKYQMKIYKDYRNSKKPLFVSIAAIILALISIVLAAKTFDFSAIILLIGLFVTKYIAEKEWEKQK